MPQRECINPHIQTVFDYTKPLAYAQGERLPLLIWAANGLSDFPQKYTSNALKCLTDRGIAAFTSWNHGKRDFSLAKSLSFAKLQKEYGQLVSINANDLLHHFCNGNPDTAHIAEDGSQFFDTSPIFMVHN